MPVPEPPSSIVAFDSGIRVVINIVGGKNAPARLQLAVGDPCECGHGAPLLSEEEAQRVIDGLRQALMHLERLKATPVVRDARD